MQLNEYQNDNRQMEELLRVTIDSSLDMIQVFKAVRNNHNEIVDFVWILNNKTSEKIYGNVIGKSLLTLNPGVIQEGIFDTFKKVTETGIPDQSERYYIHEQFNGWFLQSTVKQGDGVSTTTRDITDRKKAEQEILRLKDEVTQKTQDKYYSLFNSIDDGFLIIELIYNEAGQAVDYRFLEVNPAHERMTGLKNVVGKTGTEVAPNTEPYWLETYQKVAESGEPLRFENYNTDTERWYSTYTSKVGKGENRQVAIVFEDVTLRKKAEIALRESEEQKAFLLKLSDALRPLSNPVEIQQTAMQVLGEHLKVNRAFYSELHEDGDTLFFGLGYTHQVQPLTAMVKFSKFDSDMVKHYRQGLTMIIHDVYTDVRFSAKARANFDAIEVKAAVGVPLLKDGRVRAILSLHQSTIRQWTAVEVALTEETAERTWAAVERAKAEEIIRQNEYRLQQLLKLREEFIGIASHELKTPVTAIKAYTEFVKQQLEESGDTENSQLLGRLDIQIDRLIALISHLLDMTGLAEGQVKLRLESVDINEVVRERIEELKRTTAHRFVINTEVLKSVPADRERMGQVITNLLTNAIKYSPNGTVITTDVREKGQMIEVSIRDEGYGISEENQAKIFDRFFRVTANTNTMSSLPGMGLGLYIAAQIIRQHGGSIAVKSKLAEGSVFSFTLPYLTPVYR